MAGQWRALPLVISIAVWSSTGSSAHECRNAAVFHPSNDGVSFHTHDSDCERVDDTAFSRRSEEVESLERQGRDAEAEAGRRKLEEWEPLVRGLGEN